MTLQGLLYLLAICFAKSGLLRKRLLPPSSQSSSGDNTVLLAESTCISRLCFLNVGFSAFLIQKFFGCRILITERFFDIVMEKRIVRYVPQPIFDRAYLQALYKREGVRMQIKHNRQSFDAILINKSTVLLCKRGDASNGKLLTHDLHRTLDVTNIAFCPSKRILLIGDVGGHISVCSFDEKLEMVKLEVKITNLKCSIISIEGRTMERRNNKGQTIGFKTVFVVVSQFKFVTLLELNSKYEVAMTDLYGEHKVDKPNVFRRSFTNVGFCSMVVPKFKNKRDVDVILVGSVFGVIVVFQIQTDRPYIKLFEQVVHTHEHDNYVIGISYLPERDCFQSISRDGQSIYWTLTQNVRGIFEEIVVIQK